MTEPAPLDLREPALPLPPPSGRPEEAGAVTPATAEEPQGMVALGSGAKRAGPADLLAAALDMPLPAADAIKGERLTLQRALAGTSAAARLQATDAYWRLVAAVAEYHYAWEERDHLVRLRARAEDASLLRTAQAGAAASAQTAQVAASVMQMRLAELAGLPAGGQPPLPADLPHLGTYRTYFEEMFGGRAAPGRTRLIHRTLPLRRQAIEIRATAVTAADDAWLAAAEAYASGRIDLAAVLAARRDLTEQRRGLLRAIVEYNRDIAEYAVAVADPGASSDALVGMLIKRASATASPANPAPGSGGLENPGGNRRAGVMESGVQPATHNEPTPAPPRPTSMNPAQQPTLAPLRPLRPMGEPDLPLPPGQFAAPAPGDSSAVEPAGADLPLVPLMPAEGETTRTANRLELGAAGAGRNVAGLYPTLIALRPALRAKQLSQVLYSPQASQTFGRPVGLAECVKAVAPARRRATLTAYWLAAEHWAEHRARVQQSELLVELRLLVLERRRQLYGAEAMLRLRTAELAADAETLESHAALFEAQENLARELGAAGDAAWQLPGTLPHAGDYELQAASLAPAVARDWAVRRLAMTVPALRVSVWDRAAAVVDADTTRSATVAAYGTGTRTIEAALDTIQRQQQQTLSFIDALTQYNRAIGEYCLAVLPASTSPDELAKSLVVR